jgi:hypothetical protein
MSDDLITRPDTLDVPAALADKRRVHDALTSKRSAELKELIAEDFDLYLEQRRLYRQLVAEGRHRGITPPRRPWYIGAAKTTRAPSDTQPVDPVICRPRTGSIATSTSGTAPARTSKSPPLNALLPNLLVSRPGAGEVLGLY